MIVSTIGLGHIGGSMSLKLKACGFADRVIGVDANPKHQEKALALGIIDEILPLAPALREADFVIVAIPVDAARTLLPDWLDLLGEATTVIDVGSTKSGICQAVAHHPKRKNFVAMHPIAGTENSGPEAAFASLFEGKSGIICNAEQSGSAHVSRARACLQALGMYIIEMEHAAHDMHIAYVSHLSHITSFALGHTVLEIEKDEKTLFNLAGSGFESTVRLAKSSPNMWAPIFKQNKKHILAALTAYIENLNRFKRWIEQGDEQAMMDCMRHANDIRRVLASIES